VRAALVATFRRLMRLYFRDVERLGDRPGAEVRGRVFVCNHGNALIDPILVITDAECVISPIAKSTLWSIPGLRWLLDQAGAVPIVRRVDRPEKSADDNAGVFERVAEHLAGGGNVLIFPEGTSHSEPQLVKLRTGAARMLIAAASRGGVAPTYQAVGLEFDARSDFRSRCLILWGPVRGRGDGGVDDLTAAMAADLGDLLVKGETVDERRLVARVAELLAHGAGERSLGAWSGIGRQVELAHRTLQATDARLVRRVAEAVEAYYAELARRGVTDLQIAQPPGPPATTAWRRRIAIAPLAGVGYALYAIPYFVPRWIARRSDEDAVSTVKLGAALIVYPGWAAVLVAIAFAMLPAWGAIVAALVIVASPFAALDWLDAWYQRTARISDQARAGLAERRRIALEAIAAARSELGL
jgi:1-acyl-sn-glycerol-3-phosphate acyltransferase